MMWSVGRRLLGACRAAFAVAAVKAAIGRGGGGGGGGAADVSGRRGAGNGTVGGRPDGSGCMPNARTRGLGARHALVAAPGRTRVSQSGGTRAD